MGEPSVILGIRITRNKKEGTITLDQEEYIQEILNKYNMEDSNGIKSPMEIGLKLDKNNDKIDDNLPYQSLVGALMYLVQGTRPDIAYPVHYLSKFNKYYGLTHWKHLKRVLKYLKETKNLHLTYERDTENYKQLTGYGDASWNPKCDGKSVSGYLYLLNGGPISWNSKNQDIIALSTCEAEYVALCEAIKEGKWIQNLLTELNLTKEDDLRNIKIYCDNQPAISIIKEGNNCKRSKHINLKYLFVRKEIEDGNFDIENVSTKEMLADGLTKSLSGEKLQKLNSKMGLKEKFKKRVGD